MSMRQITAVLFLALLAGCVDAPLSTGTNTYTATYTNPSGVTSTQAFTITVN